MNQQVQALQGKPMRQVNDMNSNRRQSTINSRRGLYLVLASICVIVAVLALVGCAGSGTSSAGGETTGAPSSDTATPSAGANSKMLIVYFSREGENYWNGGRRNLAVGNTQHVAQILQSLTGADVFRIRAADPYPDSYEDTVARNVQEQNSDARPAIADPLPDISGYDTVFLGSPVWNMQEPMIMRTFCENYDFSGKTVYPFATYAVSGAGRIPEDYAKYCRNATIGETLAIRGEEAEQSRPQVQDWLKDNGLAVR